MAVKIYTCAFRSNIYIDEAKLCIEALRKNGKFQGEIFLLTDLNVNISGVNVIKAECRSISDSAAFRLKIFDYVKFHQDDIVIYMDTDVVTLKRLPNFTIHDNKVHVYGYNGEHFPKRKQIEKSFAGHITNDVNIVNMYPFCTGILVFKPSKNIESLFKEAYQLFEYHEKMNNINDCWEQPMLNLVLARNDMYEISLNEFVHEQRTNKAIRDSVVFNHLCGMRGPSRRNIMSSYIKSDV